MAGESADAVAASQLERARRLEESARRWRQGAAGERATALALEGLPPGWVVLHDLAWPGRQRANIDHVLVGPPGVVVVDTKNWTGRVELVGGVLRAGGRDRSSTVWGVEGAARAIADAVPGLPRDQVHAALCFTGERGLDGFLGSVLVTSDADLVGALARRPARLTPRQVWDAAELVRAALGPAGSPRPRVAPPRPEASSRRDARTRTARARRRVRGLRRLALGAVVAALLVAQPQVLRTAADAVGSLVTGPDTPSSEVEAPTADRPSTQERREARQPRRERERQERRERREARETQARATQAAASG